LVFGATRRFGEGFLRSRRLRSPPALERFAIAFPWEGRRIVAAAKADPEVGRFGIKTSLRRRRVTAGTRGGRRNSVTVWDLSPRSIRLCRTLFRALRIRTTRGPLMPQDIAEAEPQRPTPKA